MSVDHSAMKLGSLRHFAEGELVKLRVYALAALTWPASQDNGAPDAAYPMRLNDQIGDCTVAGLAHLIVTWAWLATKTILAIDDATVLAFYEAVSGYVLGDESTDTGCDPADVVAKAKADGLDGHKIEAAVDCSDLVLAAIHFFGGCYLSVALPITAQTQAVWDLAPGTPLTGDHAPGSWGLHEVIVVQYDEDGVTVITWGQKKRVTHRWCAAYMTRAFALLSSEMLRPDGKSAEGFDVDQLRADLAQIGAAP